jgi:hypothetical protein
MPDIKGNDFARLSGGGGRPAAGIVPAAGNAPEPGYFVTASRIRASADP